MNESFEVLGPDQVQYLEETAEKARQGLCRFADHDVAYGSGAIELLDEWIERHLEQSPEPSDQLRLTWTSLLGEVIRQRFDGRWILQRGDPRGSDLRAGLPRLLGDGQALQHRCGLSVRRQSRAANRGVEPPLHDRQRLRLGKLQYGSRLGSRGRRV